MTSKPECNGICLTGGDFGLPYSGVAYAHPDCELHGDAWIPKDNEWSREHVADHPERFGGDGDDET